MIDHPPDIADEDPPGRCGPADRDPRCGRTSSAEALRMHPTNSERSSSSPRSRKSSIWLWSALGLLLAAGIACIWIANQEPGETLRYGQFKRKLAAGEVRSARVGPAEITGELARVGP